MSRHIFRKKNLTIAYGYDEMMPPPMGGYFFQVFDSNMKSNNNEEGLVLDEGFVRGISKNRMIELMSEYGISNHSHLTFVALDLPI